jgi:two-component system NtrC family response regulator
MYLENQGRRFTERDLKAFAAMLVAVSPAVAGMAGTRTRGSLRKSDLPHTSELMDLILAAGDLKVKLVFSLAAQAAAGQGPIMIQGEAGTAKAPLAEYIHSVSPRKGGRLVPVNLANIPEANLEAILFGEAHTPGQDRQIGLVELADGGTLFLHHVELLPLKVQKLVLIMLEEGQFHPLGAHQPKEVNLRVISSTSTALDALVDTGRFRRDLYLRLAGLSIATPPLRQIKGDLENFLKIYLSRTAKEMGINFQGVDPGVVECLRAYSWPGNLTELKLEAGLMLIFNQGGRVTLEDLPAHLRLAAEAFTGDPDETPPPLILEAERRQLAAALSRCQGDLERVADLLGRPPEDVIVKMRKLGLDPINYQGPAIRPRPQKSEKTATLA